MIIIKKNNLRILMFDSQSPDLILHDVSLKWEYNSSDFEMIKKEDVHDLLINYFMPNHLIFDDCQISEFYISNNLEKYNGFNEFFVKNNLFNSYNTFLFSVYYIRKFIHNMWAYGYISRDENKGNDERNLKQIAFSHTIDIAKIVETLKRKIDCIAFKVENDRYINDISGNIRFEKAEIEPLNAIEYRNKLEDNLESESRTIRTYNGIGEYKGRRCLSPLLSGCKNKGVFEDDVCLNCNKHLSHFRDLMFSIFNRDLEFEELVEKFRKLPENIKMLSKKMFEDKQFELQVINYYSNKYGENFRAISKNIN